MPLFEKVDRQYAIPSLKGVDWNCEPEYVQRVVRSGELAFLDGMSAIDISSLLKWLASHHQMAKLHRVFVYLLQTTIPRFSTSQGVLILEAMIDILQLAPTQVIAFADIDSWHTLPANVQTWLSDRSFHLLQAFCLAANEMQVLLIAPFRKVLSQITHMSKADFASIIEFMGLVVRDPNVALELLMGSYY